MQMLIAAGERCGAILSATIRNVPATDVQCDEIWGFVQKKQKSRHGGESDFARVGNAWIFVAIERHTKLVLAHHLGKPQSAAPLGS